MPREFCVGYLFARSLRIVSVRPCYVPAICYRGVASAVALRKSEAPPKEATAQAGISSGFYWTVLQNLNLKPKHGIRATRACGIGALRSCGIRALHMWHTCRTLLLKNWAFSSP